MLKKNLKNYNKKWKIKFLKKGFNNVNPIIKKYNKINKIIFLSKNPYEDKNNINRYLLSNHLIWENKQKTNQRNFAIADKTTKILKNENIKNNNTWRNLAYKNFIVNKKIIWKKEINKVEQKNNYTRNDRKEEINLRFTTQTYIKGYLKTNNIYQQKGKNNTIPTKKAQIIIDIGEYLNIITYKKMVLEQRDLNQVRKIYNEKTGNKSNLFNFFKNFCKLIYSPNEFSNYSTLDAYLGRFEKETKIQIKETTEGIKNKKNMYETFEQTKKEKINFLENTTECTKIKNKIKIWLRSRLKNKKNVSLNKNEKKNEEEKLKNIKEKSEANIYWKWKEIKKRSEAKKISLQLEKGKNETSKILESNETPANKAKNYWNIEKYKKNEENEIYETLEKIGTNVTTKKISLQLETSENSQKQEQLNKKTKGQKRLEPLMFFIKQKQEKNQLEMFKYLNSVFEKLNNNKENTNRVTNIEHALYIPTKKTNLIPSLFLNIFYLSSKLETNENKKEEYSEWNINTQLITEAENINFVPITYWNKQITKNIEKKETNEARKNVPINENKIYITATSIIMLLNRLTNKKAIEFIFLTKHVYTSIFYLKYYFSNTYNNLNPIKIEQKNENTEKEQKLKTKWKNIYSNTKLPIKKTNEQINVNSKASENSQKQAKLNKKTSEANIKEIEKQAKLIKNGLEHKKLLNTNIYVQNLKARYNLKWVVASKLNSKYKKEIQKNKEYNKLEEQKEESEVSETNTYKNQTNLANGYTKKLMALLTYKKNEEKPKNVSIMINEITSGNNLNQERAFVINFKRNKLTKIQNDNTWYNTLNIMDF